MLGADAFFYWGQLDLNEEIESDVFWSLFQPEGSMFYNRSFGTRMPENNPSALSLQIALRYSVEKTIGLRNQSVTNGENGYPDRRVAVSQSSVSIELGPEGQVDVQVDFIPIHDYESRGSISLPMGVS